MIEWVVGRGGGSFLFAPPTQPHIIYESRALAGSESGMECGGLRRSGQQSFGRRESEHSRGTGGFLGISGGLWGDFKTNTCSVVSVFDSSNI